MGRWSSRLRRRPPAAERRTFRDTALEEGFRRDGYVVVDLLDEAARTALLARFGGSALDPARAVGLADGFHITLYEDEDDRRAVRAAIDEVAGPALAALLDRHRLAVATFLTKLGGGAAIDAHIDWTYLDEARFRSATVWCPLVEVGTDGRLGVVPGSHRRVDFVRPVNQRDHAVHRGTGEGAGEPLLLDVAPGRAVVMDGRLLHWSEPNASGRVRVVAGCVMVPDEAPLCLYWHDDDTVWRTEVDPDFFHRYQPGTPPAASAHAGPAVAVPGARSA